MESFFRRNVLGFLAAIALLVVVGIFVCDFADGALDGRAAAEASE